MRVATSDRVRVLAETNIDDLFSYFARRVHAREDAADLVGETMLVVWRRAADIPQDATKARMWVFGIARHVLMNHERGMRRRGALDRRIREQVIEAIGTATSPHDFDDLRHAIRLLPPSQQEILLLVYGEGFSLIEASKMTGSSASTTRTRHSRALAALRERLPTPRIGTVSSAIGGGQ